MSLKNIFRVLAVSITLLLPLAAGASTPDEVLAKAADKVRSAKGLSCSFSLTTGGKTVKGTMKSSGKKFALLTPVSSTWYDGKSMWTYNRSTNETSLMNPTAEEIAEANPMSYLSGWNATYKAAYSKRGMKGKYTVELTPKRRNSAVRKVEITLSGAFVPERFSVTAANGTVTTVSMASVNYSAPVKATDFVYPKGSYPNAEIIDLR